MKTSIPSCNLQVVAQMAEEVEADLTFPGLTFLVEVEVLHWAEAVDSQQQRRGRVQDLRQGLPGCLAVVAGSNCSTSPRSCCIHHMQRRDLGHHSTGLFVLHNRQGCLKPAPQSDSWSRQH